MYSITRDKASHNVGLDGNVTWHADRYDSYVSTKKLADSIEDSCNTSNASSALNWMIYLKQQWWSGKYVEKQQSAWPLKYLSFLKRLYFMRQPTLKSWVVQKFAPIY